MNRIRGLLRDHLWCWRERMARAPYTALVALLVLATLPSCSSPLLAPQPDKVTVGMEAGVVNSLIYIAQKRGLFAANRLDVTIKAYPSGLAASEGMLRHEVDISTAAEFALVGKALAGERLQTIATIDKFQQIYLVARSDRGIASVTDLKGKVIGLTLKSASEFYLGRHLDLNGLNIRQVRLVNVPPGRSADALAAGEVDAVIAWRPIVNAIEARLGSNAVMWPAQNQQVAYCSVLVREDWIGERSEVVNRFVRALVEAERYAVSDPAGAHSIVREALQLDDGYLDTVWPEHELTVSLEQSLVLAMEDEARWSIKNNLTDTRQIPNFLDFVHVQALQTAKPAAVNIIR